MREVVQQWDDISVKLSVVLSGLPAGGLGPTCIIFRESDSTYYNNSTGLWVGGPIVIPMISPTFTGLYEFTIPSGDLVYATGFPGYLIEVTETTTPLVEHIHVTPARDLSAETLDNTLTVHDAIKRIVALRQDNMNVKYTAYTVDGKPTAGTVWIYNTKAAADADTVPNGTGSIGSYAITAGYDGTLRLDTYKSTRET